MFGRYPNRRLTLRDVLRVRAQRAMLLIPVYLALELGGVLPDLRDFVRTQGPVLARQLETARDGSRASPSPVPSDRFARCRHTVEGTEIVFQRPGACDR